MKNVTSVPEGFGKNPKCPSLRKGFCGGGEAPGDVAGTPRRPTGEGSCWKEGAEAKNWHLSNSSTVTATKFLHSSFRCLEFS